MDMSHAEISSNGGASAFRSSFYLTLASTQSLVLHADHRNVDNFVQCFPHAACRRGARPIAVPASDRGAKLLSEMRAHTTPLPGAANVRPASTADAHPQHELSAGS